MNDIRKPTCVTFIDKQAAILLEHDTWPYIDAVFKTNVSVSNRYPFSIVTLSVAQFEILACYSCLIYLSAKIITTELNENLYG